MEPMIVMVVLGLLVMWFVFAWLILQRYVKVGPNEALIISGRSRLLRDGRSVGFRVVRGGRAWPIPFLERVEVLSLEIMTIDVKVPEAPSVTGVPVTVEAVAQIKVRADEVSIGNAAERFLGKTPSEIMGTALYTMEGRMRAVIGRRTIEDLLRDAAHVAQEMQQAAGADLAPLGLSVEALTIKSVSDSKGYIEALAEPRLAMVKRDAALRDGKAACACGATNLPNSRYCCQCGQPM